MAIDKSKYTIHKEGDKEYILASEVNDYAKECFQTSFGVPSYRTIRYYVTEGIIDKPRKKGRETYFEISYIINCLSLIEKIYNNFRISVRDLKKIIRNIMRYNQTEEVLDLFEALEKHSRFISKEFLKQELMSKKPSDIRLSKIEKRGEDASKDVLF